MPDARDARNSIGREALRRNSRKTPQEIKKFPKNTIKRTKIVR
jgi:hypothetical protein